jgi:hypothetical protein
MQKLSHISILLHDGEHLAISQIIQSYWDACARHVRRHPRKYATIGFVVIFLPQWIPAAVNSAVWVSSTIVRPIWTQAVGLSPTFSLNWITAPIGIALLLLVWRQTRRSGIDLLAPSTERRRLASAILRRQLGQPSGVPDATQHSPWLRTTDRY